jgi:malate dehydrogenase
MSSVAIIGAGELGGAVAQALARLECAREIRLIDAAAGAAAGKALDLAQAAPVDGYSCRLTSAPDARAAAGADVIVIADRFGSPSKEWEGEEGLALVRRVWELAETDPTTILCAGASQRMLIARAVSEARVNRNRIVGSAPAAFESAARALAAIMLDGSPTDVSLMVIGAPPRNAVPCWSQATVAGAALTSRLSASQIARLDSQLPRLWPPAPYALGSAAARVIASLLNGGRDQHTVFVSLDGELGMRRSVAALPARLGPRGLERIIVPELNGQEKVKFENGVA